MGAAATFNLWGDQKILTKKVGKRNANSLEVEQEQAVERFLKRAITASDVTLSLHTLLSSEGCKTAFDMHLKKSLCQEEYVQYSQNLRLVEKEFCDSTGDLLGNKDIRHHYIRFVCEFVDDSTFKTWRASEIANTMAAINHFHVTGIANSERSIRFSAQRANDELEDVLRLAQNSNDLCCNSFNSAISMRRIIEIFKSVNENTIDAILNGQFWLVQFLSIVQDVPIPCTVAQCNIGMESSFTQLAFANKSFNRQFNVDASFVQKNICMNEIFYCSHVVGSETTPLKSNAFWQSVFVKKSKHVVSAVAQYDFSRFNIESSGTSTLTMKLIFNADDQIAYIITLYCYSISSGNDMTSLVNRNEKLLSIIPNKV